MKRIALIGEAGMRDVAGTRAACLMKRIREMDEEINLYIFRSAGAGVLNTNYNIGEYNIFSLPDLSAFDAVILDLNRIHHMEQYGSGLTAWEYIVTAARRSGKPVVSLANAVEGFYHVGVDNYTSMKMLMEHIYTVHQCRKMWFFMGPRDHYENGQRVQAIKDYLKEHKEPCEENQFYYESFESRSGYRGFLKFLEEQQELPQAVVCANDEIAIGVCKAAEEKGFRVPDDFIVTGFDNTDKASYFFPRITTINHDQRKIADKCMELLTRIWKGEEVEAHCYTEPEGIFEGSCGCRIKSQTDYSTYIRKQFFEGVDQADIEEEIRLLEYELLYCETLEQMYEKILKGIPFRQSEEIYLVLDKNIEDFQDKGNDSLGDIIHLSGNRKFHVNGYPKKMNVVSINPESGKVEITVRNIQEMLQNLDSDKGGREFLFLPIHFSQYTVGYIIIISSFSLMEDPCLDKLMSTIMTSMESFYRNKRLEYINQNMEEISVRDAMTGLYNRLGYQNQAMRYFEKNKEKKQDLSIVYIDMDRLKYVNDTFGHEWGDAAIKIIAGAILKCCPEDAVAVRMGGDEFLVVQSKMEQEEIAGLMEVIRAEIHKQAMLRKLPCTLDISVGSVNSDMNSDKKLDDYVREADEIMYQGKRERKKHRNA